MSSFSSFCRAVDKRDTFSIRIGFREAAKRLDRLVTGEGSAEDFLRSLQNIRKANKDSLGNSYRSFIDTILKSGADRSRFIQELLQNADDCNYPAGVVPAFSLTLRDNKVVLVQYNETGFTRSNIRAITDIADSTKNKLINAQYSEIGEKGVGFKTIFNIASEVKIFSGEYSFKLTDHEPTIPKPLPALKQDFTGTRMGVLLKESAPFAELDERTILEMCLCLRKLKAVTIDKHNVTIKDSEGKRIVTIDGHEYVFIRFVHKFIVQDKQSMSVEMGPEQFLKSKRLYVLCLKKELSKIMRYIPGSQPNIE